MITKLRAFGAFWYNFIVGDDWRIALGVVLALLGTWIVSSTTSLAAWWVLPVALVMALPISLIRATRRPDSPTP